MLCRMLHVLLQGRSHAINYLSPLGLFDLHETHIVDDSLDLF